jgi:hypothetical protein
VFEPGTLFSRLMIQCLARAEELLKLAVWYREYAERTGNPEIWASRIRTAERLEEEAAQMEAVARYSHSPKRASGFQVGRINLSEISRPCWVPTCCSSAANAQGELSLSAA